MNENPANNDTEPSDTHSSLDAEIHEPFGEGKKVLLVEDDPATAELVQTLLTDRHFEVSQAQDGNVAWRTIESGFQPNVIVCDFLMPEMNGFELFKKLKGAPATQHIPTIFLSARKNMEDSLLATGADAFFSKPLDTTALLKTVKELALRPLPQSVDDETPASDESPDS